MPKVKLNESRILPGGDVRHAGDEITVSGEEASRLVESGAADLIRAAAPSGKRGRRGTETADA